VCDKNTLRSTGKCPVCFSKNKEPFIIGGFMSKNSRVFLGGTCNNSTWRDELINMISVDYFNPVVKDWTPECQDVEMDEKENKCNIHLYVITKEMIGTFSIAEAVDSSHNKNVRTILHIIPNGFDEKQLKSLKAVIDLVNLRGGIAYCDENISRTAHVINNCFG